MLTKRKKSHRERDSLDCVVCGNTMVFAGNCCGRCQSPMELSRSAAERKSPPRFLSVLGSSGAGKTVFLGTLLDLLSKGHGEIQGTPNGAFSVALQQNCVLALQQRRFPDKTANEADSWNWVHCEVSHKRRSRNLADIITPDLAGEAISTELDQPGEPTGDPRGDAKLQQFDSAFRFGNCP